MEDGALHVWSTTGIFPEGLTPGSDRPVVVHTATYSFDELARWYRIFNEALEDRAQSVDIDERANRLAATVPDQDAARVALTTAGVPDEVYRLRDPKPVTMLKTLLDEFRPVPGGVQSFCTVGFNVEHWEWGKAFITNSHCTDEMLVTDGKEFPQPATGGIIGTEVFDDPGFTGGECGSGFVCRYSDAAVVAYASGIDYELGKVARPTEVGSITINESNPRFGINHEELSIFSGENVLFVGWKSGWQEGEVITTCANKRPADGPSNLKLICQAEMSVPGQPGDSGSPVLAFADPSFGEYVLAGTLWGRTSNSSWFSPLEGVRKEINPNPSLECDGLATTATGGCGEGDGGGGNTCDDDPTAIEC